MTTVTDNEGPSLPGPVIASRRSLPSGRAAVGALLVTVAAVGAFVMATGPDEDPRTSYLVAVASVEAGAPVGGGDFALRPLGLSPDVAARALTDASGLEGATAVRDLAPGDLLTAADLIGAPAVSGRPAGAVHEIAFPVPVERISARTVNGDRVTVLTTASGGSGGSSDLTEVAVEDGVVLSWVADADAIGGSGVGVLTLAVSDAETAIGLAHMVRTGDVTVVRTTRAVSDRYPDSFPAAQAPGDIAGPGSPGGPDPAGLGAAR